MTEEIINDSSDIENEKKSNPPTIIFAGFARLPANASMPQHSGSIAIEIEVDPFNMKIVDVACNCLPALGQKLLSTLLIGKHIGENQNGIFNEIRSRYISTTQRAVIAALEDTFKRFEELKKEKGDSKLR